MGWRCLIFFATYGLTSTPQKWSLSNLDVAQEVGSKQRDIIKDVLDLDAMHAFRAKQRAMFEGAQDR